jgi:hypothetical protein
MSQRRQYLHCTGVLRRLCGFLDYVHRGEITMPGCIYTLPVLISSGLHLSNLCIRFAQQDCCSPLHCTAWHTVLYEL